MTLHFSFPFAFPFFFGIGYCVRSSGTTCTSASPFPRSSANPTVFSPVDLALHSLGVSRSLNSSSDVAAMVLL